MDLWSGLDDLFSSVGDFAVKVAPSVVPAALGFGAVKLMGGTTQEALIGAGVAGASNAVMRGMRAPGGEALGDAGVSGGSIAPGEAPGERAGGALDSAGISDGAIASRGGQAAGSAAAPRKSLVESLGLTGADLLKAGGTILESMDTTDDDFRERGLDILDRRTTVAPVSWRPNSPGTQAVTQRSANAGAGVPLVRWANR